MTRREHPYIFCTWLTGLMAGDKHCVWAAWFRAHYKYEKRIDPNENTLSQWRAEHADLVQTRADELRHDGWAVQVEQQNKFAVRGRVATIGGVADIVATRPIEPMDDINDNATGRVEDCKTGVPKDSDYWQVILYLLLLPKVFPSLRARRLEGAVVYPVGTPDRAMGRERGNRQVSEVDAATAKDVAVGWIKRVGGDDEPDKSPSWSECRYCDIAECLARAEEPTADAATEDF